MTTTAPPGILTGTPPRFRSGIAVPGICHLEIAPRLDEHEWITPDRGTRAGDLVIGETRAHGALRLNYETVAAYRALALYATRVADWLEAGS